MARGGSIYERPTKAGDVSLVVMWRDAAGRQVKRTLPAGTSRRDAERFLTARLAERDRGDQHAPDRRFRDLAEEWLAYKRPRCEAGTWQRYEADVRLRLLPALGDLRLRQVTRARIERMLVDLDAAGTLSRKTINAALIPLRGILDRAVRDGILSRNPARARDGDEPLELPYEAPTMLYLNERDVRRYLAAAPDWYAPLARFLLATGVRIGEAVALDWSDVDLDGGMVRVERSEKVGGIGGTKTDEGRSIPLDAGTVAMLRAHRASSGRIGGRVFTSPRGLPLNKDNVRQRGHAAALRAAGLDERVRLHDLRHTAATLLVAEGWNLRLIQARLGHRDVRTTMRYAHPDLDAHRAAAAGLARIFG